MSSDNPKESKILYTALAIELTQDFYQINEHLNEAERLLKEARSTRESALARIDQLIEGIKGDKI